jgi:hypothetical protein
MIDEMMLVFDSPGSVSKVFIIALLPRSDKMRGADAGHKKRRWCRGFSALSCP